ncbi:MAG: hypothetical protein WAV05_10070 [Anaerolineales bacterium]
MAGIKGATVVGVVLDQIGIHPIKHRLGHLCAAWIVENDRRAL